LKKKKCRWKEKRGETKGMKKKKYTGKKKKWRHLLQKTPISYCRITESHYNVLGGIIARSEGWLWKNPPCQIPCRVPSTIQSPPWIAVKFSY
jgi:hypothetical protein